MLLKEIKAIFHKELDAMYGKKEVDSFFVMCLESFYNIDRLTLALNPETSITKSEQTSVFAALEQLKQETPIQYILGETEFYGLRFKVNNSVLIPRPETEELVEWIITYCTENYEQTKNIKILDIGTGSGCIPIALAKNIPSAKVYALDISKEAIEVATKNALLNNVDITFFNEDILNLKALDVAFDIIVSNPPYVRASEKQQMRANVLDNEPHLALFVEDNDALLFYKHIAKFSLNNLEKQGTLFFEINEQLGHQTVSALEEMFNSVELRKDLFNKDRMIKASII